MKGILLISIVYIILFWISAILGHKLVKRAKKWKNHE